MMFTYYKHHLNELLPNGSSWDQVLEYVSDKVIKQKDKSVQSSKVMTKSDKPKNVVRKPIAIGVKRIIFQRDKCCQYKDKITGNQCNSKWHLTIDHIHPVWAGGNNDPENLRVLCANHNQYIYRQQAKISPG